MDDLRELTRAASPVSAATLKAPVPELRKLAPLLEDPSVNDILINGPDSIFVERNGKLEAVALTFRDEKELRSLGEAIARAIGRRLDPARPLLDARLADGSRVNIISPPLSVDGTTISIRKFSARQITLDDMAANGTLSPRLAEFLKICGRCRLNMIISGGTGSGKTTLLNAISQHIDDDERVVTIEDAAELKLMKKHVVRLETWPASSTGGDAVNTRDLVKNALRMRPDRIIVGEVRGEEAFDMMQAMNTGHEGSLTTIHANHPRDALFRLENIVGMAGSHLSTRAIRGQISAALHLIIQTSRMSDGVRRVTFVSEIVGMEGDVITMQDLAMYAQREGKAGEISGEFQFTGIVPRALRRIAYWGEKERLASIFGMSFK